MRSWIRDFFIDFFVEENIGVNLLSRGITAKPKPDYKKYLKSAKWKEIRERVLIRHNHACGRCGGLAYKVHHKSYDQTVLDGLDDEQLIPVCKGCHHTVEFRRDGTKTSAREKVEILAEHDTNRNFDQPNIDLRRRGQKRPKCPSENSLSHPRLM